MLIKAILAIGAGALLLLRPRSMSARVSEQHERRLAELRSGAEEAFFEERRSLEAYPPPRSPWALRLGGAALLAGGLWVLFGLER